MLRFPAFLLLLCLFSCNMKGQNLGNNLDSMANLYAQLKNFNGSVLVAQKGTIPLAVAGVPRAIGSVLKL